MKRPFGKSKLSFVVLFLLMFAVTISASFWTQSLARERGSFQVIFTPGGDSVSASGMVSVLDLADQGIVKKLFQPTKVTVTTGHGPGILNKRTAPLWIQVRTSGFSSQVKVSAHDINFNHEESRFEAPVNPGRFVNIEVVFSLSKDKLDQEKVDSGIVEFVDYKTGDILAKVPIEIINSSK